MIATVDSRCQSTPGDLKLFNLNYSIHRLPNCFCLHKDPYMDANHHKETSSTRDEIFMHTFFEIILD